MSPGTPTSPSSLKLATKVEAPPQRLLVSIEGNIGVGKSTLLGNLRAHFKHAQHVAFVDEPVGLWEQHGLLAAMYDGSLSRCSFQLMALATRYAALLNTLASDATIIITERSIHSDRACFARVNLDSPADKAAYAATHDALCDALPKDIKVATVLLEASRKTLAERIARRGRAAETPRGEDGSPEAGEQPASGGVPDEYLAALDDAHADYYQGCPASARRRVDASATADAVCAAVLEAISELEDESPAPPSPAPTAAAVGSPMSVLCDLPRGDAPLKQGVKPFSKQAAKPLSPPIATAASALTAVC